MKFLTKMILGAASLTGLLATSAMADDAAPPAPAWGSFSAYVAVQSDYRFRGISQNDQSPSPEASINWSGPDGFYAGTWLAKVNFLDATPTTSGTTLETDIYGGKHFDLDGTDLNVEAYYYTYPDHNNHASGVTYSYYETIAQLSHTWGNFTGTISGAQSPDFFAETGSAWWVAGTGSYTINDWLSISGNLGHQWVNHTLPEYTHYDIGLTATYKTLSLDARYLGTDLGAAKCVAYTAGKKEWCSGGFAATLTYNIAAFPW